MPISDLLFAIPTFLIVLSIIVVVHEMGHFWAARLNGVAVARTIISVIRRASASPSGAFQWVFFR